MRYVIAVVLGVMFGIFTGCATDTISTHTIESPHWVRLDVATNIMPLVHVTSGSTTMKKGQKIVIIDIPATIKDDPTWIIFLTQVLDGPKRLTNAEIRPVINGRKLGLARIDATDRTVVHWSIAQPPPKPAPRDPDDYKTF